MIRVVVVDRHPTVRAGVEALLAHTADARVVGAVGGEPRELAHTLYALAPDLVLVEDSPGRMDGVELCREIKALGAGPRVLLHADGLDPVQVATAVLADADGVVDSRAEPRELVEAIRAVAAGGTVLPELAPDELAAVARRLPVEDHSILAMRLAATPTPVIGRTLTLDVRALRRRMAAIIVRLRTGAAAAVPRAPGPAL